MQKYISVSFLLILTSTLLCGSCKKFLTQQPYNSISINDIFRDFEGARTTIIGCYDNIKSTDYYTRDLSIYADVAGGNIKYPVQSNQIFWLTYNFNNDKTNNDLSNFYKIAYNTIYRANSILENINKVTDASQSQINRMKADAYAFRALAHFDLVRVFAQAPCYTSDRSHPGIVLKLKNTVGLPTTEKPSTVAEVYNAIVTDLDSAKSLFNNSVGIYGTGNEKFFFSANAITALQSRVQLYNENYAKVVELVKELLPLPTVPGLTYDLNTASPNGANTYVKEWSGRSNFKESIMEIQYGNNFSLPALGISYNYFSDNPQAMAASNDLLSLYTTNDRRGKTPITNTEILFKPITISSQNYFFTKKYLGYKDSSNNIKLFRTSELYLNRAEAFAKMGMITEALADLNKLRKSRFGSSGTTNDINTLDQTILIDEILNERRRELCFEGHLLFDLARNKKDIIRTDCQAATNCNITYPSDKYIVPTPINN